MLVVSCSWCGLNCVTFVVSIGGRLSLAVRCLSLGVFVLLCAVLLCGVPYVMVS